MEEELLFVCLTMALRSTYKRLTPRSKDGQRARWMESPKNKPKHLVLSVSFTRYTLFQT